VVTRTRRPRRIRPDCLDAGAASLTVMALVAGMLAFGLVVAVAATFVVREAGRIAREPPPALFDPDDAYDFVVEHVPDDVAATLTAGDVRRILDFQLEFFKQRGVTGNGTSTKIAGPAIAYILRRAAETGEAYLPEQVHGVIETQLRYLRAIGAVGPAADPFGEAPSD
jgi:hypothetical protein